MKLKVGRTILDTEKAVELARYTEGHFGDEKGFEEILFRQNKHFFFLAKGGSQSPYPFEESIISLSESDAKAWFERVVGYEKEEIFYGKTKTVSKEKSTSKKEETSPAAEPAVKKSRSKKTA